MRLAIFRPLRADLPAQPLSVVTRRFLSARVARRFAWICFCPGPPGSLALPGPYLRDRIYAMLSSSPVRVAPAVRPPPPR